MSELIPLYEGRLPYKHVKIVYSKHSNQYYIITTENGELKIKETHDHQFILDFIIANEIYKNEQYNLNSYPQIEDFE